MSHISGRYAFNKSNNVTFHSNVVQPFCSSQKLMYDFNKSFDLEGLENYRRQVLSRNSSFYELPVEEPDEEKKDCTLSPGTKEGQVIGELCANNRLLRSECEDLKTRILQVQIKQKCRDAKREHYEKMAKIRSRGQQFDANFEARLRYLAIVSQEEHLRQIGLLREQIEAERRFRARLRLPVHIPFFLKLEDELFPELPEDSEQVLQRGWYGGPENEVVAQAAVNSVDRKGLLTLVGSTWLNDEVINFYVELIMLRSKSNACLPKTYGFSTFFYETVDKRGYNGVKRWTRKVDLFSYDVILVPVHLGNHWCSAVIDFSLKSVNYYDSLNAGNRKCLKLIECYLMEEHRDKKKSDFDFNGWSFDCPLVPHQQNHFDCGVFTCCFMELSSRHLEFQLDQRVMPYMRRRIAYEILTNQLIVGN